MTEIYPQFASWLHSLTSTEVCIGMVFVFLAAFITFAGKQGGVE